SRLSVARTVHIVPPPATDVTQTLARGAMPLMIVPLRDAPRWLNGKQQWRIAATNANFAARPTFTIDGDLVAGWEALIYVESTRAMRMLPGGRRKEGGGRRCGSSGVRCFGRITACALPPALCALL